MERKLKVTGNKSKGKEKSGNYCLTLAVRQSLSLQREIGHGLLEEHIKNLSGSSRGGAVVNESD